MKGSFFKLNESIKTLYFTFVTCTNKYVLDVKTPLFLSP